MSSGHQTRSYIANAVNVAASTTAQQVANLSIDNEMRLNFKVDIVLGQVAGTPTIALQDSNGLGIWNSIKSNTLSASTDKTVSAVSASTGTLTSASHGFTAGQLVTINSTGTMPGGLLPGQKLFIVNPTTNTFQVTPFLGNNSAVGSFKDAGSGTITVTAATVATIAVNAQTSGDVQYLPLRPQARLVGTTSAGQTLQVIDVRVGYTY